MKRARVSLSGLRLLESRSGFLPNVPSSGVSAGAVCSEVSRLGCLNRGAELGRCVRPRAWGLRGDSRSELGRVGLRQQPGAWLRRGGCLLPAVPAARGPPGRGTVAVSGGGFLTSGLEGPVRKHRIWACAQYPRFEDLKSLLRNNCHPPPEPFLLPE